LALVGATMGFMRYNFFPARIFMGDTGSMLLGFLLAAISFQGLAKRITIFTLLIPVLLLGIPILDTILSFARRIFTRKNPFAADRDHIHHKMIRLGLTQVQAVTIIYIVSALFGVLSLTLIRFESEFILALLIVVSLLVFAGLWNLGYFRPGLHPDFEFIEKRTVPRSFKEILVEYEYQGQRSRAVSLDISAGGMFLRTSTPLELGSHVRLFFLDPVSKKRVERESQVVWNTTDSQRFVEFPGMGIMFVGSDDDQGSEGCT